MTAQKSLTQSELWKVPKDYNTKIHAQTDLWGREAENALKWCRGGELNSLRRPFQGRALPVSYPGTEEENSL